MRTFTNFMTSQNEIFGWGKNKLYNHPQYGKAFAALVQQHGGDEKAAEVDLRRLASTPAGQHKLLQMAYSSSSVHGSNEVDPMKSQWQALSRSGADMYKPQY